MADIEERIRDLITQNDVFLFMKGSPALPQCGFSAKVVQVLQKLGVPYRSANVLEDGALREGVKSYANWPTIPQLYIKGQFVGGCDIISQMFQSGELTTLLAEHQVPLSPTP